MWWRGPRDGVTDDERQRQVFERIRELDHAHRSRARAQGQTGMGLALSLRFLRSAVAGLLRPPRRTLAKPVPLPSTGGVGITFVGHATVMLTTPQSRVLTDPFLGDFLHGLRRRESACLDPADAEDVDLIVVSHAHRDHLDRASLRRLPRTATIAVPARCEGRVADLGFADVIALEPGEEISHRDLVVTAVAARHGDARANGYVLRGAGVCTYFAGDTGYFSGFADIGRRFRPHVAVLPIAGYQPPALRDSHMSPLDAVTAFEDLGARVLIPIAYGSFQLGYEPMDEPRQWLERLCAERGHDAQLAALAHGETCRITGVDVPPPLG